MYLYNPVSGELKVSDKQIEGFEQITLLKYKSLKSKKTTDLQINGSALEVDGVNGVKGKNTKIIGKKTDDSLTVEIDADTGKIHGLVIEAENKAIVPTVSPEDNSNNAATTNWVNSKLNSKLILAKLTPKFIAEEEYIISPLNFDGSIIINLCLNRQFMDASSQNYGIDNIVFEMNHNCATGYNNALFTIYSSRLPLSYFGIRNYLLEEDLIINNITIPKGQVVYTLYLKKDLKPINCINTVSGFYLSASSLFINNINMKPILFEPVDPGVLKKLSSKSHDYSDQEKYDQYVSQLATVNSPEFTGNPKAPTAPKGTNTNQLATMEAIIQALEDYPVKLKFNPIQQGGGIDQLDNKIYLGWSNQAKLKAQVDKSDLGNIALETWVNDQGYLKQDSLRGYATEQWVNEQGYLKQGSLNDYATKNYVDTLTGGSYISRTTSGNFTGSGHGNITFTISLTVISQIINKDVISFVKIEFMPLQNTSGGNETITMGIVNLFNVLKFTFTSNIDGSTPVHTTSSTCVPDLVRCTVNAIDKIFRISGNGGGNGWSIGGNVSNTFISNTIGRFTA